MAEPANKNLSGKAWWQANQAKYPNSDKVSDLEAGFRKNVEAFLKALNDAGAKVVISSTKRNETRAHLMHYSWKLAKGEIQPGSIPKKPGLDIEWDHGDRAKSKQAAQEMVDLFGMKYIASLTSNHIAGKAIDMSISWSGTLKIQQQDGKEVEIKTPPASGQNTELHKVGKTYGVIKLATDPPHWSYNGH